MDLKEVKELLSQVKGKLVDMPLDFLIVRCALNASQYACTDRANHDTGRQGDDYWGHCQRVNKAECEIQNDTDLVQSIATHILCQSVSCAVCIGREGATRGLIRTEPFFFPLRRSLERSVIDTYFALGIVEWPSESLWYSDMLE